MLADDGGLEHAVDGGQDRLDLLGVQVLASADDHVLHAIDDAEVAVVVEHADVPGAQPAVDDGLCGGLGTPEVAPHDGRAGDQDLAALAVGDGVPVLVDDTDLLTGEGGPDGPQLADAVDGVAGGGTGAFGQPVPLDHLEAVALVAGDQQLLGHRCGTADDEAQRRGVRLHRLGQGHQHRVDRRHGGEVGGPQPLDVIEEPAGGELADDGHLPAGTPDRQHADHDGVHVEQRKDQHAVVLRCQAEVTDHLTGHGLGVVVVQHHALGPPGGPARVDEEGQVAAVEVGGVRPDGWPVAGRAREVVDADGHATSTRALVQAFVDHDQRVGILDLVAGLVLGEHRVDGCGYGAEAPGRQHHHQELDAVGQHDGHHVTPSQARPGQLSRYRSGPVVELPIGQLRAVITHGDGCSAVGRATPREVVQAHVGSASSAAARLMSGR